MCRFASMLRGKSVSRHWSRRGSDIGSCDLWLLIVLLLGAGNASNSQKRTKSSEDARRVLDKSLLDARGTSVVWRMEDWRGRPVASLWITEVPVGLRSSSACRGEVWLVADRSWSTAHASLFAGCDARLRVCNEANQLCGRPERAIALDLPGAGDASAIFVANGSLWAVGGGRVEAVAAVSAGGQRPKFEVVGPLFRSEELGCSLCTLRDLSVVPVEDDRLLLYAREKGGIQVARGSLPPRANWTNFEAASFATNDGMFRWTPKALTAPEFRQLPEIYAATLGENPLLPSTIIGIFAVLRPRHQASSIDLALSCDGVNFTALRPVIKVTFTADTRRRDVPVEGFVFDDDALFFYVFHTAASNGTRDARLTKYAIPAIALKAYVMRALPGLPGCPIDIRAALKDARQMARSTLSPPRSSPSARRVGSRASHLKSIFLRLIVFIAVEFLIVLACLYGWPPPEYFTSHPR